MVAMTSQETTLETATTALRDAQEALRAARRDLTAAITTAYLAGEPAARIAERTGQHVTDIRNLLAATQATRRK
jgi:DNA-directed RNA polymerase specialized sigma24 family protein